LPTLIEPLSRAIPEGTMSDEPASFYGQALRFDRTLVVQYSRDLDATQMDAAVLWKRWRLINNTSLHDLPRILGRPRTR
jgi:hypothetical protein